ncbi:unnamed protein product [Owenia fusiformis]|uniref:Uncharacterized protein n=1 Tax=Owenia fusiformis TaxID=6347 RepID=A0A8J1XK90_OWEFU|nr:unnamed protein product [Owenia fusiformis]
MAKVVIFLTCVLVLFVVAEATRIKTKPSKDDIDHHAEMIKLARKAAKDTATSGSRLGKILSVIKEYKNKFWGGKSWASIKKELPKPRLQTDTKESKQKENLKLEVAQNDKTADVVTNNGGFTHTVWFAVGAACLCGVVILALIGVIARKRILRMHERRRLADGLVTNDFNDDAFAEQDEVVFDIKENPLSS